MFSIVVLVGLVGLVASQNPSTMSYDGSNGIFQVEVGTSNIGRIKYEDGEVILSQNQRKPTDIFFTPFPYVDPTGTECRDNLLSDHVELVLSVELYTSELIRAVDTYVRQRFPGLCGSNGTCDISLLPMTAIRLVLKGLRTAKARQLFTINDEWHSNTLLLQSIDFIIYTANDSYCEQLRSSIRERCRLSNFEIQYSLHSEKTVERQIEITSEQITSTSMYNRIRSQFPKSDMVALTGGDFKQLTSEVTDRITMKVRIQEGFDSQLQDPIALDKHLERQLQFKQVHLEKLSDQLWDSLYWTHDVTRPDRLAKAINTVIRKNSTDANHFRYDSQAAKNIHQLGLTQHDVDRFEQLDKMLATHAHSSSSSNSHGGTSKGSGELSFLGFKIGGSGGRNSHSQSNHSENIHTVTDSMYDEKTDKNHLNVSNILSNNETQYVLSRADVEKYLSELSDHIHLEGEIILPKTIDAHLIKLSTLRAETKLLSHTALVRTRTGSHPLPLRCPSKKNKTIPADINTINQNHLTEVKVEQLTKNVEELTNSILQLKALVVETEKKWTSRVDELDNTQMKVLNQISNLNTSSGSQIAEIGRMYNRRSEELENRITSLQTASKANQPIHPESNSLPPFTLQKYEIYTKFANPGFSDCVPGTIFQYTPGLSQTFKVEQPTLFKATIQGGNYNEAGEMRTTVQLIVNDHVVAGDMLISNKAEVLKSDHRFQYGSYFYSGGVVHHGLVIPVTRISYVYLRPGTYTFNVGVKCFEGPSKLEMGMVTYELIQYKDINLKEIGGLKLTAIAN